MNSLEQKRPKLKPKLTARIFAWGVVNVIGMAVFSVGLAYLTHVPGTIFKIFPTNDFEAALLVLSGGGIMVWGVGNILREMMKQPHLMDQIRN